MPANSNRGFKTHGNSDSPGGGYKRNFNRKATGAHKLRIARAKASRSKSRG